MLNKFDIELNILRPLKPIKTFLWQLSYLEWFHTEHTKRSAFYGTLNIAHTQRITSVT